MNIDDIKNLHNKMTQSKAQFGTLASNISDKNILKKQSLVKVVTKESLNVFNFPEAKDFKREFVKDTKNVYHHLGVYCYQIETLKKFVSFDQTQNEIKDSYHYRMFLTENASKLIDKYNNLLVKPTFFLDFYIR